MNPIGLLEQQEELRRLNQQIHFLNGKARAEAKRQKLYFQLVRRVRRLRKRLLRDLESVRRKLESRTDLAPSRRLMGQEVLSLIAEDLAVLEQAAKVCERRIMEQEKVPMAEKIVSLSDSDASLGNAADSPHLVPMLKEQITNTGVIPSIASVDDGYSSQQGREELLGLGVKVVSIGGAKGTRAGWTHVLQNALNYSEKGVNS